MNKYLKTGVECVLASALAASYVAFVVKSHNQRMIMPEHHLEGKVLQESKQINAHKFLEYKFAIQTKEGVRTMVTMGQSEADNLDSQIEPGQYVKIRVSPVDFLVHPNSPIVINPSDLVR